MADYTLGSTAYTFGTTTVRFGDSVVGTGPSAVHYPRSIRCLPDGTPITPMFVPGQASIAVPVFVSGNTAGPDGSNGTVATAVPANPNRTFLMLINTGNADIELWVGARPADANVGVTPGKGIPLVVGGSFTLDTKILPSAIYASASSVSGLVVLTDA